MSEKIEQTKARIRRLEIELAYEQQQPLLFGSFAGVRESNLVKCQRSLQSQRDKLRRLEGQAHR